MSEETIEIIAQKHCYPEAVHPKPHLDKPEVRLERYPLFENPEEYLKFRNGKFIFGFFKRWFENRAIEKSIKGLDDIHSVCDIPCGPGWLFPYWRQEGYKAIGADLSEPMVEAAREIRKHLNLEGRVLKYNAMPLP